MRELNYSTYVALVPDLISSMFDEDLFVEVTDFSGNYADGDYFPIVVGGVTINLVMYNSIGRYYFDNFYFEDFGAAAQTINITSPFTDTFQLIPKKTIGSIATSGINLLPLWNLKNNLSLPYLKYVAIENGDTSQEVQTLPSLTKNFVEDIERFSFQNTDEIVIDGIYTNVYTDEYNAATPTSGSWTACRTVGTCHTYFEWIDDDGNWRSWYFKLAETKTKAKDDQISIVKNISSTLNERRAEVALKYNTVKLIYTSGHELKAVLDIISSIKSSSYVFMGDDLERVSVTSVEYTDFKNIDEFIFTVERKTKVAR